MNRHGSDLLEVGGLTPLTSIDYPGELAAVIYCRGCPWRCRYCHNAHLLAAGDDGGELIGWAEVMAFLKQRWGLIDAVVFSGGEPTAQSGLGAAMTQVRGLGFKIGLHTGGPCPERLVSLLPLLDWVGLDIKALPEDYPLVTGVPGSGDKAWRSLRLLLDAGVSLEVRTTPMRGLDNRDYLQGLMQRLSAAGVTDYVLQQCQPEHVLDPTLEPHALPLQSDLWPPSGFRAFSVRTAQTSPG